MKLEIGKTVKKLREKNHMTQEQLASEIDISVTYLSKIENDRVTNISLAMGWKLSSVFNVTLGYLVGEENDSDMVDDELVKRLANCSSSEKKKVLQIIDIIRDDQ